MRVKKSNKKIYLLTATILVGAALISSGALLYKRKYSSHTPDTDINYSPPTEQEKAETDKHKESIASPENDKKTNKPPSNPGQQPNISVVITSATQDAVYAYVDGVFEDGGTCTATFTNGAKSFQKTSDGFTNVSNTQCAPIFVTPGDFTTPGDWQVTVSYSSSTASGTSKPLVVNMR